MNGVDVETIVKQVEELLARVGALPDEAEQAIEKLLNVVEALRADKRELTDEVQRLRKQPEQTKKAKTAAEAPQDAEQLSPKRSSSFAGRCPAAKTWATSVRTCGPPVESRLCNTRHH